MGVKVVGGSPLPPSGWLVSLEKYAWHNCGATLLSSHWALTAAHCVLDDAGEPVDTRILSLATSSLTVGSSASSPGGTRPPPALIEGAVDQESVFECPASLHVHRVLAHPGYNPLSFENDIALLQLEEDKASHCVAGLVLPQLDGARSEAEVGSQLVVAGWGATSVDAQHDFADELHATRVALVDKVECSEVYGFSLPPSMLCAGGEGGDACHGDSGGPLYLPADEGEPAVLVGVVSWGNGCGKPGFPGVYTNLSYFAGWLDEHLQPSPPLPPTPPPAPPTPPFPPPSPPASPSPPNSPPLSEAEACACAADGVSAGIPTGTAGCEAWLDNGVLWCYVREPALCESSMPSDTFEGAGWRPCSPVPTPEEWGQCECAIDGISAGIGTGVAGCTNHDGDSNGAWCYLAEPSACMPFARPSVQFPGAAWSYCRLPSYTRCIDDPYYSDENGGCKQWEGRMCTVAHFESSGWTAGRRDWLVYSCPESCADVLPECDGVDEPPSAPPARPPLPPSASPERPPPSAPPPLRYRLTSVLTLDETLDSFDGAHFAATFARFLAIDASRVVVSAIAASVVVSATIEGDDPGALDALRTKLDTLTPASASSALNATVESINVPARIDLLAPPATPPPPCSPPAGVELDVWLIIFAAAMVVCSLSALMLVGFFVRRRQHVRRRRPRPRRTTWQTSRSSCTSPPRLRLSNTDPLWREHAMETEPGPAGPPSPQPEGAKPETLSPDNLPPLVVHEMGEHSGSVDGGLELHDVDVVEVEGSGPGDLCVGR